ncbi:MAG: hypothetical protein QHI48_00460 [Bacteroidota bacterium]|nr:hypothetical protein [Bacteroidota bacterium]
MKRTRCLFVLLLAGSAAFAQGIPSTMNYQGYLTDLAGAPYNGVETITFSFYTVQAGGTPIWTEVQDVPVIKGLFTVVLGAINPLTLPFDQQYYLGIRVGADLELAPRVRLTSSAYSMRARMAEDIIDGAITAPKIADNAVTGPKIADGAVGTPQIVNGAVIASKIADNVITANHIVPAIVSSINNVTNDGGNINLVAGANVSITADDAANTITIAATPGGGGLTLPYSNTTASTATAFSIENTGTGSAGEFTITNTSSVKPALSVKSNSTAPNGDGIAVEAVAGNAVQAINNSADMAAIAAMNTGEGMTASFVKMGPSAGDLLRMSSAGGTGKGINLTYSGTTQGIFTAVPSTASATGMEVDMNGTGAAAYFHVDHTSSDKSCLRAVSNSTDNNSDALETVAVNGNAVDARNNSAASPTIFALNSSTASNSSAGYFESAGMSGTIRSMNTSANPNSHIFEGYAGTTQVFRMYNSGNFYSAGGLYSDHAVLRQDLGSSDTPMSGGYYRDNVVYAWANVSSAGQLAGGTAGFGCTVTKTATGTYDISYKKTMSGYAYAPMAIAFEGTSPQFAVISSASSTGCTVKIWKYSTTTNTFSLTDSQFFFILCGRP